MRPPELQSYSFRTTAQWRAGTMDGLRITAEGLVPPAALERQPIAGTDAADGAAALTFDAIGRLHWLRRDGQLRRLGSFGIEIVHHLETATPARAIAIDGARLWVLTADRLLAFAIRNFQKLLDQPAGPGLRDIAADGHDGLWLLEEHSGPELVIHRLDAHGRAVPLTTRRALAGSGFRFASFCDGRRLALLEPTSRTLCPGFRLWLIDLCAEGAPSWRPIDVQLAPGDSKPDLVAVDRSGDVLVGETAAGTLWQLTGEGDLLARVPNLLRGALSLAAGPGLAIGTDGGIVRIAPATSGPGGETLGETLGEPGLSRFLTPVMVSPEDNRRGWLRVEIEAVLPPGTSLTVEAAAGGSPQLAAAAQSLLADPSLTGAEKLGRLENLLPWRPSNRTAFTSDQGDGPRRLRAALDDIETTRLWLKLELYRPPGRTAPRVSGLDVLYPNLSLLRFLPAIYAQDPVSAARLRRFLAPFESLIGELDATLHRLPREIDPETAAPERLAFLARWRGADLPTHLALDDAAGRAMLRRLLRALPGLLERRGTLKALEELLEIVTDGAAGRIDDAAFRPMPWVLPGPLSAYRPRLGCDTMVHCRSPGPLVAGKSPVPRRIGQDGGDADPARMLARHQGELRIEIAVEPGEHASLRALLEPLLRVFVPAHCRVTLVFTDPGRRTGHGRLDRDLELARPGCAALGAATVLGGFRLPDHPVDSAVLDWTARTDQRHPPRGRPAFEGPSS
jgi:phage tail-like protein